MREFQGDFGAIDENQECNNIEKQDKQDTKGVDEDQVDKIQYNPERRRSSFSLAKLGKRISIKYLLCNYISAPAPPDPLEGTWKLIQCENYEKYLEKIGTGPLSLNMVMRANVVVTIAQVCIDK